MRGWVGLQRRSNSPAGVSEGEIMTLCGWKTRDMFDRYNIIDDEDQSRGVELRFNGKDTARKSEIGELVN